MKIVKPLCHPCWDKRNPENPAVHIHKGPKVKCYLCGRTTWSGIYARFETE